MPAPIGAPDDGAKGTSLMRMPLTSLNRSPSAIRQAVREFRRSVENEVLQSGGGGVLTASKVHSACVSLSKHLLAERRLAEAGAGLALDAWLNLSSSSLRWKHACDAALKDLGLQAAKEKLTAWQQFEEIERKRAAEDGTKA